jgi:hypothetical protein
VRLNLPGDESFDPTFPKMMKWDDLFDRVAGDMVAFVDDCWTSGCSKEHAWAIARQVAPRLQCLGVQDAPRKQWVDGGAWAGAIMLAVGGGRITKTISQEKWERARSQL